MAAIVIADASPLIALSRGHGARLDRSGSDLQGPTSAASNPAGMPSTELSGYGGCWTTPCRWSALSEVRESFKAVLDRVEADADVTLITRRHAKGAVVM